MSANIPENLQRIVLASRPKGAPVAENFRLETAPMPAPPPDGVLLRTLYFSLDPYMRGRMDDAKSYAAATSIDEVMTSRGLAEVIASNHPDHRIGDIVVAGTGWQSHAAVDATGLRKIDRGFKPLTATLGILGMPGFTAYVGLNVIAQPKPGETVAVASATGPVGSTVGQLARLAGARAVGIAGGPEKCRLLTEELGFDAAVDHRDPDFARNLAAACPAGIDVYFENVGGAVWQAVLPSLNRFARVPVCGLIAQYNGIASGGADLLPATMRAVLTLSLEIRGFINGNFFDEHFQSFLDKVMPEVQSGRFRYREDLTKGLENAPFAFMGLLQGRNFGKALVQVAKDSELPN